MFASGFPSKDPALVGSFEETSAVLCCDFGGWVVGGFGVVVEEEDSLAEV